MGIGRGGGRGWRVQLAERLKNPSRRDHIRIIGMETEKKCWCFKPDNANDLGESAYRERRSKPWALLWESKCRKSLIQILIIQFGSRLLYFFSLTRKLEIILRFGRHVMQIIESNRTFFKPTKIKRLDKFFAKLDTKHCTFFLSLFLVLDFSSVLPC